MTKPTKDGELSALSLDALAEDLFGLSLRALHSVRVLWTAPRRYFDAAKIRDWADVFTPSIRLWLSFFALFSALKFWWLGRNQGLISAFSDGFAEAQLILPDGLTYDDVGREAVLWVFGLFPFLQIASMILLSIIYPVWGERTTLALRQRFFFAMIVPSASLMPVFLTAMMCVPSQWMSAYGVALAVFTLLIDFQTGVRGGFASVSGFQRIWRAALLSLIVVSLNVAMSVLAQIAGIVVTSQKYGVAY